ncbi:hypothetical protein D3C78_1803950 [compost metagenome]
MATLAPTEAVATAKAVIAQALARRAGSSGSQATALWRQGLKAASTSTSRKSTASVGPRSAPTLALTPMAWPA